MSALGLRLRMAVPAVLLLVGVAAVALLLAIIAGFAPAPPVFQAILTLLTAALLGVGVAYQVRGALEAWQAAVAAASGVHRRGRRAGGVTTRPMPSFVRSPYLERPGVPGDREVTEDAPALDRHADDLSRDDRSPHDRDGDDRDGDDRDGDDWDAESRATTAAWAAADPLRRPGRRTAVDAPEGADTDTGVFTRRTRAVPSTDDLWGDDGPPAGAHDPDVPPPRGMRRGDGDGDPDASGRGRPRRVIDAESSAEPAAAEPPGRPRRRRPSWLRMAVIAAAVAVLVLALWVRPKPVPPTFLHLAGFLVGVFAYAVPLLPLLLLMPLPRVARARFDVAMLLKPLTRRALWTREELALLGIGAAKAVREHVFSKASGIVLATIGLLHLVRGAPPLSGGASRAGGLIGWLIGEPLRLAYSAAGATGLLVALLCCAGTVVAAYVSRFANIRTGSVALAIALGVPLTGATAAHWVGYDYYLTVDGPKVVVVAGLAAGHRQATHDTGVAVDGLPGPLRALLSKGLRVGGVADGNRIVKALAAPGTVAATSFVGDQYELRVGECFDFIGGSSQLRYLTPCNAAHVGEVYFVGHLPFVVNPGKEAIEASSRSMCEQSYGQYLGVPYGQSYLPMETPLTPVALSQPGGWLEKPVIACWLGAIGPRVLKGSKIIASLQQKAPWDPGDGCKAEEPDMLRITADKPNVRCVAPGARQPLAIEGGAFLMQLEYGALGKTTGNARIGAGCLDSDAATGYSFMINPDGVIEIWKQAGGQRTKLAASAKPKGTGGPPTTQTPMEATCRVTPAGVELTASSSGNRKVTAIDKTTPVTRLSPRLIFESAEVAPAAMSVLIFDATRL